MRHVCAFSEKRYLHLYHAKSYRRYRDSPICFLSRTRLPAIPCSASTKMIRSSIIRKAIFLVPHRKDYYFMAFVKAGSNRHWIDMMPYVLKPNIFCFTIPHQVHLKETMEPLSGITISFTEEFMAPRRERDAQSPASDQNPWNGHQLDLDNTQVAFIERLLNRYTRSA